jgi:hypothetical protein
LPPGLRSNEPIFGVARRWRRVADLRTERTLMRTERAIDRSELAGAAPVALPEPFPRRSLVEILDY